MLKKDYMDYITNGVKNLNDIREHIRIDVIVCIGPRINNR